MGIAISDESKLIAQPLLFIPAHPLEKFVAQLNSLLHEREVELIVVGLPRNMDGTHGPAAAKVREFVAELQKTITVPIKTWDERLTSVQANRMLSEGNVRGRKQRQKVDQTAAAILLQSYLDSLQIQR